MQILYFTYSKAENVLSNKKLIDFENDLLDIVKNATFRKVYNNFHGQLNKGIKS